MAQNGSEGNGTLTIRDNRTGQEYEVPILEGDVVLEYEGSEPIDVQIERRLVVESVGEVEDGGEIAYWRETAGEKVGGTTERLKLVEMLRFSFKTLPIEPSGPNTAFQSMPARY